MIVVISPGTSTVSGVMVTPNAQPLSRLLPGHLGRLHATASRAVAGGLVARLAGGVGVERGRDGDAPLSVRSGDELVGVAFQVYRCSTAIEILQYEPADPDTGHLNVGHNLASAYALDSTAAVEVLALGEEVT